GALEDPAVLIAQKILLTDDPPAVEHHTDQTRSPQASEKEIALEIRKGASVVEHAACRSTRRRIFEQRWLQPGLRPVAVYRRPAVILSALDDVHLVSTAAASFESARAVLGLKHQTRTGLPRQTLRIAMPGRKDLRSISVFADERIIVRNTAVAIKPQRLSGER